jgi:hypothetical protein
VFDPGPSFWEQIKTGVLEIWGWLTKAGAFGVGLFVGSVFLKPVVDLIAAIESRRKASIELQRTKNDSHEHLRTIGALESALSEAKATIVTRDSRLREVGLRRYIIGACVGLLLGGAAAAAFYFRIPPPVPPTPTAKYAEGYALGYSDGLVGRKKVKAAHSVHPAAQLPDPNHDDSH